MKRQLTPGEKKMMRTYRNAIETAHSVLVSMGVQRLHAVTQQGFGIKVYASLLTLAFDVLFKEAGFTSN